MKILFLCTGNSARSVLAEALANNLGRGRVTAYSAGSFPKGQPHPFALDLLRTNGIDTVGLRSKSWNEFAAPGAPEFDAVITVCDTAAQEVCPVWPGKPIKVHWGIPDPAAVTESEAEQREAFMQAYTTLERRITLLLALPVEYLKPDQTLKYLREIADTTP